MKLHLKWPNWLLALLSTLVTIAGSLFIYSPGIGYGGWLMITLPLAPVVFVSLWIALRPQRLVWPPESTKTGRVVPG